ncbi:TetR/AcrR family transcriptional regulator [Terrarubrum flagellatum]|uniref:TetR/AcrR family transcriptional regulator n=1 Tax=Terrirubrum flagellatum TaxID=2895980 RepID=UPI003145169E
MSRRETSAAAKAKSGAKRASRRRAYHHGDLRAAMVAATLAIIREEGLPALSVRAAAKRAGVSAGAPFRHFASRRVLLTAVAEEATEKLACDIEAAVAASRGKTPADALRAISFAYLDWALANPAQFETISDRRLIDYDQSPVLRGRNDGVRALLDQAIGDLLVEAGRPHGPEIIVRIRLEMRALGYGLARMLIDGHFSDWGLPGETPRRAMERVIGQFIERLARA